jgi:cytochrome c553
MKAVLRALLLLLVVAAIVAGVTAYSIASRGLSTRVAPSAVETLIARAMRRLATPAAERSQANPVAATPEVMDEARAHFADHCASCHANDGSGNTDMGRSFYPPAPDMRADATAQRATRSRCAWPTARRGRVDPLARHPPAGQHGRRAGTQLHGIHPGETYVYRFTSSRTGPTGTTATPASRSSAASTAAHHRGAWSPSPSDTTASTS